MKIRRNSHYGYSPIAYHSKEIALQDLGSRKIVMFVFHTPKMGVIFILRRIL